LVGGLGAAIGTFVGDVVFLTPLGLTTPLLSLIAGVPGNFIGFYLLGWFMRKYRSWGGFVVGSFIALVVGNLIAATGVIAYLVVFLNWSSLPIGVVMGALFGFTFFWLVTMIPFVIPLVPPLVHALQPLVGGQVGISGSRSRFEGLRSSLAVGGILALLYLLVQFTPLGEFLFGSITAPQFIPWLKLLFLIAALVVFAFGAVTGLLLQQRKEK
jgi:hypothetical protein